jgi:Spherulation-specific family 4
VINPSSGPGNSSLPDDNYSTQILKLNNYTNAETVGYVRTGYATQNITHVAEEVATYAGWGMQNNSLAMHGIFFDKAPHEYSADAVSYMQTINQVVKNSTLQGAKRVSSYHVTIFFFYP